MALPVSRSHLYFEAQGDSPTSQSISHLDETGITTTPYPLQEIGGGTP
jgi:hypothetical protein